MVLNDDAREHMSCDSEPSGKRDSLMLHVHDLPQLYQKPSASALLDALDLLTSDPPSFAVSSHATQSKVAEQGVPRYVTAIVSSSLKWMEEDARDLVWSAASARLSERSGRSAAPAMTRSFVVNEELTIQLHEPTLTEDNLGLKTWTAALLLSRRLQDCRGYLADDLDGVLELGAGTGLVGIAAACIWKTKGLLTDLPQIIPNLQQNLELNREVVSAHGGTVDARALDWADENNGPQKEDDKFMVILAADPIYSADHPKWLVHTVRRWIRGEAGARFIVELPLRDRYDDERQDLRKALQELEFELVVEGTDSGSDDWYGRDGNPSEVICWWSIWKPGL